MHHAFRRQLRPQTIVAVGAERRDQPVALCRLYDWLKSACLRAMVVRGLDVYKVERCLVEELEESRIRKQSGNDFVVRCGAIMLSGTSVYLSVICWLPWRRARVSGGTYSDLGAHLGLGLVHPGGLVI